MKEEGQKMKSYCDIAPIEDSTNVKAAINMKETAMMALDP